MAVTIIVIISLVLIVTTVIWLRRSGLAYGSPGADPAARRRGKWILWLSIAGIVAFPVLAIIGWVMLEETIYYERVEARVTGTERVCTVTTRSRRKGRDRWRDQTEPMACDQALAQLPRFGDEARLADKERISFVYSDPGSGGERTGFVVYDDPPSPFRPNQRISVLAPKSGEGRSRRPQALGS